MKNAMLKTLFFVCGISIITLSAAEARICYLPFGGDCSEMPEYADVTIITPSVTDKTDEVVPVTPVVVPEEKPQEEDSLCQGFDLDAPLGKDYACMDCSDVLGTHYRCHLICSADKCGEDEIYNSDTCMCDAISDNCKKYLHKFKSVAYTPLTSSECGDAKADLGLQTCVSEGNDYFAGAVMACGGTENIMTPEEAEELAYCMYNPTETYSSIYGDRYDGFLKSYNADTGDHVFVWVDWEGGNADDKGAIVRMYDIYGSIPYYAERSGSQYYIDDEVQNEWENASVLSQTLCRI